MTFCDVVALSFSFEMVGLTPSSDNHRAFGAITAKRSQKLFFLGPKLIAFPNFLVFSNDCICLWNPIGVIFGIGLRLVIESHCTCLHILGLDFPFRLIS